MRRRGIWAWSRICRSGLASAAAWRFRRRRHPPNAKRKRGQGTAMQELINAALVNVFSQAIPEIVLIVAACAIYLGGTFRANRHLWAAASLAALLFAAAAIQWTA